MRFSLFEYGTSVSSKSEDHDRPAVTREARESHPELSRIHAARTRFRRRCVRCVERDGREDGIRSDGVTAENAAVGSTPRTNAEPQPISQGAPTRTPPVMKGVALTP